MHVASAVNDVEPRFGGYRRTEAALVQYVDHDGRLGAETVKQLNVPLSDKVRQLQLALERWRWLPSEFSSPQS
jgi:murein L,D-transpeptidase YcbB/YkuD